MPGPEERAQIIRKEAQALGFEQVGFAKAERLDEAAIRLERWLNSGAHGTMHYMENHFEKRVNPCELVPGAKTVVSLSYNYYSEQSQRDETAPRISMYAYGRDYHKTVRKKLKQLLLHIREKIGEVNGRCFVDSAPVMEREWAQRSGIGWNGKNTLTIHPRRGSYFFLAELIIDIEVSPDAPMRDHCGSCTRCIDACPTEAIAPEGYRLNASKCLSYLTIELKEDIPHDLQSKMDQWMFGCDICQQVCPWNRFAKPHNEVEFNPREDLLNMKKSEWIELTEEVFQQVFEGSAVKRTGFSGLRRNIRAALGLPKS